jgi:hypothetical protein
MEFITLAYENVWFLLSFIMAFVGLAHGMKKVIKPI